MPEPKPNDTPTLTVARRAGDWWVLGDPSGDLGPYDKKAEAVDDRRGLLAFYRHGHRRGFVTTEPKPKKAP
jgi:hypothetical protein